MAAPSRKQSYDAINSPSMSNLGDSLDDGDSESDLGSVYEPSDGNSESDDEISSDSEQESDV